MTEDKNVTEDLKGRWLMRNGSEVNIAQANTTKPTHWYSGEADYKNMYWDNDGNGYLGGKWAEEFDLVKRLSGSWKYERKKLGE